MISSTKQFEIDQLDVRSVVAMFGEGPLIKELKEFLLKKNLLVHVFNPKVSLMPVFLHPSYVFYFLYGNEWDTKTINLLKDTLNSIDKNVKIVILGINLTKTQLRDLDQYLTKMAHKCLRINCTFTGSEDLNFGFETIAQWLFSGMHKNQEMTLSFPAYLGWTSKMFEKEGITQINFSLTTMHNSNKKRFLLGILLLPFFLFFAFVMVPLIWYLVDVKLAYRALKEGKYEHSRNFFSASKSKLSFAKNNLGYFNFPLKYLPNKVALVLPEQILQLGMLISSLGEQTAVTFPELKMLAISIVDPYETTYDWERLKIVRQSIAKISEDISQITLIYPQLPSKLKKVIESKLPKGWDYLAEDVRVLSQSLPDFVELIPQMIGNNSKQSYLILLQNSAELRPTGGFIGSFALLDFEKGKVTKLAFHDVYTADGQLKGRVEPPEEILHFLGQPSWYLRDSNWGADFPLSAQRAMWFLDKEMGIRTDGVIAIDLIAVQKIIAAVGPLEIPDYKETITADNFFERTEFRSEINFFPGSTQKRDFISSVSNALIAKLSQSQERHVLKLVEAFPEILNGKHLMFYSSSQVLQDFFHRMNWDGSINTELCAKEKLMSAQCFLLVDSNFGANKANYYVKKKIDIVNYVSKGGDLSYDVTATYTNNSLSNTWPGGAYKNYLRFFAPPGSKLVNIDLFDERKMFLSSTISAEVLSKLEKEQFLVRETEESGYLTWGTLLGVPVGEQRKIKFSFTTLQKLDFLQTENKINFAFLKQPGTSNDEFKFTWDMPTFLQIKDPKLGVWTIDNSKLLVKRGKVTYNSTLDADFYWTPVFIKE